MAASRSNLEASDCAPVGGGACDAFSAARFSKERFVLCGHTNSVPEAILELKAVMALLERLNAHEVNQTNSLGQTPLFAATLRAHEPIARLLLQFPGVEGKSNCTNSAFQFSEWQYWKSEHLIFLKNCVILNCFKAILFAGTKILQEMSHEKIKS